jgi:hypothetical protein
MTNAAHVIADIFLARTVTPDLDNRCSNAEFLGATLLMRYHNSGVDFFSPHGVLNARNSEFDPSGFNRFQIEKGFFI